MKIGNLMKISGQALESTATKMIERLLTEAGIETRVLKDGGKADFIARLETEAGRYLLVAEVKSRVLRADLSHLVTKFDRYCEATKERCVPLLVVPYIAPPTAHLCRELGVNWADLAGNCDIRFGKSVLRINGNDNPYREKRSLVSLFTPQASKILHALLLEPHRTWKIEDLGARTGVSYGSISNTRSRLLEQGWIEAAYGRMEVKDPLGLLEAWREQYRPQRLEARYFTLDSIPTLEQRLIDSSLDYWFTESSAAERYAPYTRAQRAAFYVPRLDDFDATSLGLRGGEGATNVTVYEQGEAALFPEELGEAQCVSPILAYLDLRLLPGRAQDSAERLLEVAILPRWQ